MKRIARIVLLVLLVNATPANAAPMTEPEWTQLMRGPEMRQAWCHYREGEERLRRRVLLLFYGEAELLGRQQSYQLQVRTDRELPVFPEGNPLPAGAVLQRDGIVWSSRRSGVERHYVMTGTQSERFMLAIPQVLRDEPLLADLNPRGAAWFLRMNEQWAEDVFGGRTPEPQRFTERLFVIFGECMMSNTLPKPQRALPPPP